jgi:hypothetical protein
VTFDLVTLYPTTTIYNSKLNPATIVQVTLIERALKLETLNTTAFALLMLNPTTFILTTP